MDKDDVAIAHWPPQYSVLCEYYVTVTRKLAPGLDSQIVRSDVRNLMLWQPVVVDSAVIESAWNLHDRYHFSFWDALIAAAALQAECRYLLSEDFQHGQDISGMQVINPFFRKIKVLQNE